MKKIEAEIVADSINQQGDRLTSMLLTYPRMIHAEMLTHRVFSRNAASSRAVPVKKMIESVRNNTFCPIEFQKAHKGMQGSEYFTGQDKEDCIKLWLESAELALQQAEKMKEKGITKQIINRILEPYQYYTVLITGTEFKNFFELRCPVYETEIGVFKSKRDALISYAEGGVMSNLPTTDLEWLQINKSQAEIHMQALAEAMWDVYNESTPKELKEGEYHIPFGDNMDEEKLNEIMPEIQPASLNWYIDKINQLKIKISTARCARLSYMTFDGEIAYEKDLKLHDSLLESQHMSPFEHCARAMTPYEYETFIKGAGDAYMGEEGVVFEYSSAHGWSNNYKGFIQYRYLIENDYEQ